MSGGAFCNDLPLISVVSSNWAYYFCCAVENSNPVKKNLGKIPEFCVLRKLPFTLARLSDRLVMKDAGYGCQ